MDDAVLVRSLERRSDLLRDRQRFVKRNRTSCNPGCQGRTVDQLQDERRFSIP
jgi:hypothetical protein